MIELKMVFKIVKFLSGPAFLIFITRNSLEKYVCSLSFNHSYIILYISKYTTLESYSYNFKLFPQNNLFFKPKNQVFLMSINSFFETFFIGLIPVDLFQQRAYC